MLDILRLNSALVATASANGIELKEGLKIQSIVETALGQGGYGAVYKCLNYNGTPISVKYFHSNDLSTDIEADALEALNDIPSNVIGIPDGYEDLYNITTDSGKRYIIMEYIEGRELFDLAQEGLLSDKIFKYITQILTGLSAIHAKGWAHRDIKLDNIKVKGVLRDKEVLREKLLEVGTEVVISDKRFKGKRGTVARLENRDGMRVYAVDTGHPFLKFIKEEYLRPIEDEQGKPEQKPVLNESIPGLDQSVEVGDDVCYILDLGLAVNVNSGFEYEGRLVLHIKIVNRSRRRV